MWPDKMVRLGKSLVQHGPLSNRAYLMDLDPADCPEIAPRLKNLAVQKGYTKIFAKVPDSLAKPFAEAGYQTEAFIPGFYRRQDGARFMGMYLEEKRSSCRNKELAQKVLRTSNKKRGSSGSSLAPGYRIRAMTPENIPAMAELYSLVFNSYPFPIFQPDYLEKTMQDNVSYFGVLCGENLAGLASAEKDMSSLAAEMTDFATLPGHRGRNLAGALLEAMGTHMTKAGIKTLYTIARSGSFGMNITFARAGFQYAGTLTNNTHIAGSIESMNVWHRTC
ncbi:putative beta-lysine N-acetyltransferase [Desulfonatronovibrio hydrogenovorans]|uniref:putative beta-lysine N-acetyltransferase n=1 Tax=Desulfonatronovibrio hydrogenovorans TaxID=53245 RepID=UPI00049149BA|nr:putative beta-lysine N-acetyltransferase [Desulfonatronovibrio hydrogenovorans]